MFAGRAQAAEAAYLPEHSFRSFLRHLERHHPFVFGLIDERYRRDQRFDGFAEELNQLSWEFEVTDSGRGLSYNVAQHQSQSNRAAGMSKLLEIATRDGPQFPGRGLVLLDALAGDGTVQRYASSLPNRDLYIVSADISSYMIDCCLSQDLPCLRQSATRSLVRNDALDAVLIAYGTHHIPVDERGAAVAEAHRTLAPGGRLVVHDFEIGSSMDAWFGEVVHPYSLTGHPHPHFTADELRAYFDRAGFAEVEVARMADPFEAVGDDERTARRALIGFLHGMYGLDRVPLRSDADYALLEGHIERIFGGIQILTKDGKHIARVSREAIVATAAK